MADIDAVLFRSLWRRMPDRRTVTFRRRTAATPTYTNYTVKEAWYRPDGDEEGAPSQGVYLRRRRRWYFPKEKLANGTIAPAPADLVVNTTTAIDPTAGSWTVLRQSEAGALGAWELNCVLLEVRGSFAVTVTVQRRGTAQDATARWMPTTTDFATASGWFQPDGSEANANLLEKTQMPTRGTIYFGTYVSGLLATDTLNVGGTSYNVMSMQDPQHLEELQSVTVELAR